MANGKSSAQDAGLPKSTILASGLVILFAGAATFMILQWSGSRSHTAELRTQLAESTTLEAQVHSELDPLERELGGIHGRTDQLNPGKLAICNHSSQPIVVARLAATYLGPDEKFETFNSEAFGRDLWRLGPGDRKELAHSPAGWDGSVTYYAMWLRKGGDEYPYGGMWPAAQPDFCVIGPS